MMAAPEIQGELILMAQRTLALALVMGGLLLAGPARAQESPFISPDTYKLLNGELSGDIAFDHLRHLTLHHSPNGASRGFRDKLRWIAEKAKGFGMDDVRIIDDLTFEGVGWSALSADLWIVSPDARRLTSFEEVAVAIADYSRSGSWEGALVDVNEGTRDENYAGIDVKGKIVLAWGSPATVTEQAVWKRGALGIVYYNSTPRGITYPDQVAWTRLTEKPPAGKENTFAFSISYREGMQLKQRLAAKPAPGSVPGAFGEGTVPGETIILRARVQAEFDPAPKQWIVEGWIRGTDRAAKAIILTAHGQEEKFSANDDNSGCANLLEIGRTLAKLIAEGKMPRPRRDIRFWWVNEFSAEYEYFSRYPEERAKLLLNMNQDMVGAKQSAGSRIQHISRLPFSRSSYLEPVVESIAQFVMQGNSAYLAAAQAGTTQPYSKEIISRHGTRERYGAELVPYFDSTDHHVFNDGIIGVPGMTLTNWPDDFIHSDYDDLWQMDATQLKRNAFLVAATAWYFANARPEDVPAILARVRAAGLRDMGAAFARATEMISVAAPAERATAFLDGINLIARVQDRVVAGVESVVAFTPAAPVAAQVDALTAAITGNEGPYMMQALGDHYRLLTGQAQLPAPAPLGDEQKKMAGQVLELAVNVREYLAKRADLPAFGLHAMMKWEAMNFVNGRRSTLEIYRAVRAQAQSAGDWYYGKVTEKQIADLLNACVKAGIFRAKS